MKKQKTRNKKQKKEKVYQYTSYVNFEIYSNCIITDMFIYTDDSDIFFIKHTCCYQDDYEDEKYYYIFMDDLIPLFPECNSIEEINDFMYDLCNEKNDTVNLFREELRRRGCDVDEKFLCCTLQDYLDLYDLYDEIEKQIINREIQNNMIDVRDLML